MDIAHAPVHSLMQPPGQLVRLGPGIDRLGPDPQELVEVRTEVGQVPIDIPELAEMRQVEPVELEALQPIDALPPLGGSRSGGGVGGQT